MADQFKITVDNVGGRVRVIGLRGDADRFGTDAVSAAIAEARGAQHHVVVDLTEASYLDSSMLAVLVAASEQGRRRDERVVIVCGNGRVRRSLELKGLEAILTIADTRDDAMAMVGADRRAD